MLCFLVLGFYCKNTLIPFLEHWAKRCWFSLLPCSAILFAVTALLGRIKGKDVDVHYLLSGNPLVFFLTAITGSLATLLLSYFLSRFQIAIKTVGLMGIHAVFIMTTHSYLAITLVCRKSVELLFGQSLSANAVTCFTFIAVMAVEWVLCLLIADKIDLAMRASHKIRLRS